METFKDKKEWSRWTVGVWVIRPKAWGPSWDAAELGSSSQLRQQLPSPFGPAGFVLVSFPDQQRVSGLKESWT